MPRPKRNEPRINMTFYDDHLEFCREMAWKKHQSVTAYVNELIAKEMEKYDGTDWRCSCTKNTMLKMEPPAPANVPPYEE